MFAIIDGVMMPAMGVIVGHIVAYYVYYPLNPSYYQNQMLKFVFAGVGVSFIAGITHSAAVWTGAKMGQSVIRKIRLEIFDKLVKLPLIWFNREENQY
jgi:ABC-type multidrug transport system fused ATPase/permease subunit